MIRVAMLVAALSLVGCDDPKPDPIEPSRIVAINPATMACQEWSVAEQKFVGGFLKITECAGKPTPEILGDGE